MQRWIKILLVCMIVLGGLPVMAQSSAGNPTEYRVDLDFTTLSQGETALIHVSGDNITGARARFLSRLIDLYTIPNNNIRNTNTWHGLLSAGMAQNPGDYPLEIIIWFEDGTSETWLGTVIVATPEQPFIRQDVTISGELAYLLEPEVDRSELTRLTAIFNEITPVHYWTDSGFAKPLATDFTSPFGAWRLYNESFWGRHTGADLTGPAGSPLLAAAAGRVVLAERLDVRGNYVLLDHGWGIYSGIAHLSEIHVTRGQIVQQGQVLGISGSTGRSSGPHIHWEMAVNGEWISPEQFISLDIP